MSIEREFSDVVDVPARCQGCTHLERLSEAYQHFSAEYVDAMESGLDGTASERLVRGLVEYGNLDLDDARQKVADNPELVRESLLETVDFIGEQRDACASLATKMIDTCPDGVLKLRATRKGKQVIVSLCMSEITKDMSESTDGIETVRVERNY